MKTPAILLAFAAALSAQQPTSVPTIENAKLETRAFSGTVASELARLGSGPLWAAYSEPIAAGRHGDMCSWSRNGNDVENGRAPGAPLRLEGDIAIVILIRVENGQPGEIRMTSPDCRLDAGGLPFYWFNNVPATESIAWLKSLLPTRIDTAIMAISYHTGPAADSALDDLIAVTQTENVRKKAAFWLGQSRGAHGVAMLKRMMASDPSTSVRDQVVFALSQSKDPGGLPEVIAAARNDKDAHVRGQALFWLAQRAASKDSKDVIQGAITNDPETSVRERAVQALTQIPNGEGVPMLIDLAKNHRDPAVRKKAMFWLGQSKDPRAVEFFAQVLKP